jgi:penicillin amidase
MHRLLPLLLLTQSCALFDLAAIRKSFPTVDGELTVEGLDAAITIRRDAMGVPHVRATTEHDAWFGQGFVHGQDR